MARYMQEGAVDLPCLAASSKLGSGIGACACNDDDDKGECDDVAAKVTRWRRIRCRRDDEGAAQGWECWDEWSRWMWGEQEEVDGAMGNGRWELAYLWIRTDADRRVDGRAQAREGA